MTGHNITEAVERGKPWVNADPIEKYEPCCEFHRVFHAWCDYFTALMMNISIPQPPLNFSTGAPGKESDGLASNVKYQACNLEHVAMTLFLGTEKD